MLEDSEVGYVNIPIEAIEPGHISPKDTNSLPMRKWVYERVELAHSCFKTGRDYIARVKNFRCRLAGFAYLARFEYVLRLIEKDQYCLRLEYPERKSLHALLWMMWRVLASSIKLPLTRSQTANQPALTDQCEEG
jgi:hypothetical protein